MGYTKAAAESRLISTNGNVNIAASLLLSEAIDCGKEDQT
jgi:hypothetical protein